MNILELGCGNGALWRENYSYLPDHIQIILNDISVGMLRDTRREIEMLAHTAAAEHSGDARFTFNAFDCHQIPYEENSFDLVIANHVLFYCEQLSTVLEEVRRVLKPDGIFLCSTYGAAHMKEITDLVQGFNSLITLSADKLYEHFGLENGAALLAPYFSHINMEIYHDSLMVTHAEPLIEYVLSCHGNQNQYILDRYKDFHTYVERKTRNGFYITKHAGLFICQK